MLWQFYTYTLTSNLEITSKAVVRLDSSCICRQLSPRPIVSSADDQESLTAQLAKEQEQNAHHLAEIEDLQKDHDEKLAAFGVSHSRLSPMWRHCLWNHVPDVF